MATQVQTVTDGAQSTASGAQSTASGATDKVQGYTSSILSGVQGLLGSMQAWAMGLLDRFFPPEKRAEVFGKLQGFMLSNPKLSTFLGMNILLTGVPLGLFILFSITVLVFSLLVGLILGLLAAVLFTVFCVGVALTIVLPLIFFTTAAACFLFLWGLGGYYILKWANNRGDTADEKPLLSSGSIGDSINNLTGGRLTGFMNSAKQQASKSDISGVSEENTKPKAEPQTNGAAKPEKQSVGVRTVSSQLYDPSKPRKAATKAPSTTNNLGKKSANATGAVKGGLAMSGATVGLA